MAEPYEIYAVHYAHNPNARRANNFIGGDPHDGPMPLDYFVWVIKGPERTFVFDTGFDAPMGAKRQRQFVRSPSVGLKAIGVEPSDVRDVILSHMHYDHCGNYDLFPRARYHLQDIEMAYCTGRCMCHAGLRAPFEEEDVVAIVRKLFEGRVVFHDGVEELAPGLSVHHVGGHSKGLQVVRVWTRRGWMVLASDASHFYANMEEGRAFPIMHSHEATLEGYATRCCRGRGGNSRWCNLRLVQRARLGGETSREITPWSSIATTVRRRRLNSSAPVGSIRSRRPSGIGFVGSSRSLLMRNWTRHLVGRAIAARCRQRRQAEQPDIGMDDGTASCLVHLAR
jgi:glyoxylase-like metal-dependent hydrolase (beta-lactamase superfamily II)